MSLYLFLASLPSLLAGVFGSAMTVPVRRVMIRDEIRSRMGGSCRIDKFRLLVPQSKR